MSRRGPGIHKPGNWAVSSSINAWEAPRRGMAIVPPTIHDLRLEPQNLPVVKLGGNAYTNFHEYLSTYFLLLHEDFFGMMRRGILALRGEGQYQNVAHNMQVYNDVKLVDISFTRKGVRYSVTFANDRSFRNVADQLLKYGSLLCISDDGFETFLWATVISNDNIKSLAVDLSCIDAGSSRLLQYEKSYTMAELPSVYFAAYVYSLRNLQRMDNWTSLPFEQNLVFLLRVVAIPCYIPCRGNRSHYNLKWILSDGGLHCQRRQQNISPGLPYVAIQSKWPHFDSFLDSNQKDAIKHGLTKQLAVIQGPPGTGKTFVGLFLVKILLDNLYNSVAHQSMIGHSDSLKPRQSFPCFPTGSLCSFSGSESPNATDPILILCYTNHALDQFLEGILEFEQSLVRYGGRSKSLKLKDFLMTNLRDPAKKQQSHMRAVWTPEDKYCQYRLRKLKDELQKFRVMVNLKSISKREQLELIRVNSHQINNLFNVAHGASDEETVIQEWLERPNDFRDEERLTLCEILSKPYPWALSKDSRHRLHQYWLESLKTLAKERQMELAIEYQRTCEHDSVSPYDEGDLAILRQKKIVGMTISGAACNQALLVALKPQILIVEEAAEVLEAHMLACLTPEIKHLILIGDHMQLRPSVANHRLSALHNFNVSMFERLISGNVEHKTLHVQHRMSPSISRLLKRAFYPELVDHVSVTLFGDIRGLRKNVFFWSHNEEEMYTESTTRANMEEADRAVALALYLIQNRGYESSKVTILAFYTGQTHIIKQKLSQKISPQHENQLKALQVTSVDGFQGQENDIIILSLVRSGSKESTIGFTAQPNRICVALSRARHGLYILGNAALFKAKSHVWGLIIEQLREDGNVGDRLPLSCSKHLLGLSASCAEEIRACRNPCNSANKTCIHVCDGDCYLHNSPRVAKLAGAPVLEYN